MSHRNCRRCGLPLTKLTPYQRIMRAAKRGKGVLLSVSDVLKMAGDQAIVQLAENDDEEAADRRQLTIGSLVCPSAEVPGE